MGFNWSLSGVTAIKNPIAFLESHHEVHVDHVDSIFRSSGGHLELQMQPMWTPSTVQYGLWSMLTPCGVHVESTRNTCESMLASMWSPLRNTWSPKYGVHVESTRNCESM